MPTRTYDNSRRLQRQADLKARIAAATAQLHAAQGVLATSYAQIAQRAGVSLPTVYKHFPSLDELLQAADLAAAAAVLVEACDALNAHYEPWTGWREQLHLPLLQRQDEERRARLLDICRLLLERHRAPGTHAQIAAVWEAVLHFDFWQRLLRDHKLSRAATRACQLNLMLAAVGPQPVVNSPSRPKSRKSSP